MEPTRPARASQRKSARPGTPGPGSAHPVEHSFVAELKRRNVIRMAGLYLVASWLIVQVSATILPMFGAPESLPRTVVMLLGLAFIPVLVFSWVYELTPEGLKREHEVERNASITADTARRMDRATFVLLFVAVAILAADRFVLAPRREAQAAAANLAQRASATAAAPALPDDKSIAVLPFVNMSSDKEQEYFSDGISEELLNLLANIHELRVIARTSSFAFKGQSLEVSEIAKRLNVAHVLEGSIRKSGNTIRITAQLIRTADSSHLWSETYDRNLDDIFKVQDEIAAAVVAQLRLTLLGTPPNAKPIDPKVYTQLLQARFLASQRTVEAAAQAVELLRQAATIAPTESRIWEGLADAYRLQASVGGIGNAEGYRLARDAAQRALALDPDDAPAHGALGNISASIDLDFPAAAEHYQRAVSLGSTDSRVLIEAGRFASSVERNDDALALLHYVTAHDPANPAGHYHLAAALYFARQYEQSAESMRTTLRLSPGYAAAHCVLGFALIQHGDAAGALAEMQAESPAWRSIGLPIAYHALGRKAEADAALASEIAQNAQDDPYNIAYVHAFRGDPDRAFEWLDKALQLKDPGLQTVAPEPMFDSIRKDPRWLPFLRKVGVAPEQLAAIRFAPKPPGS